MGQLSLLRRPAKLETRLRLLLQVLLRSQRLRASEQSDFEMYTMGFVVLCLLVSHVLMVTRIVTERERGIVTAMRSMGLLDTAFWLSYVAVALVSSLLTCTLVYLVGLAAGGKRQRE